MNKTILTVAVSSIFALTGCLDKSHTLKGEGNTITDQRVVSSFREIETDGSVNVDCYYVEKGEERVVVTGYQNLVAAFETKTTNRKLSLKFKDRYWNIKNNNLEVRVYCSELSRVDLNGSGDIEIHDDFRSDNFEASINGSGVITIQKGNFKDLKLKVNGSGEIHGKNANAENASSEISGSGYISTWVTNHLHARITGSGTIDYWGSPVTVDTKVDGSGDINKR